MTVSTVNVYRTARPIVSPYLLLYIIHTTQTGEGILSFQRQISNVAGYDAWISIIITIITGILTSLVIVIIWKLISDRQIDFIDIHHHVFGKTLGNNCSFIPLAPFFCYSVSARGK